MESCFRGRSVLVTGGAGALGQKLIRALEEQAPKSVTVYSRDEMKHAAAKRTLAGIPWLKFRIGDVLNTDDLEMAMAGADIVVHAAAMKHLPECELNSHASTAVNVAGTQNVVRAFHRSGAKSLIFLSTDKAPYASSVYGAQKYIGEKLVGEAALHAESSKPGLAQSSAGFSVVNRHMAGAVSAAGTTVVIFGSGGIGAQPAALVLSRLAHFFHTALS